MQGRKKSAAGDRFPFWLAEACSGARTLARATVTEVARIAGVSRGKIYRFEGESPWPENPEELVAAYASAVGMDDSRQLWRVAIGLWERYGSDPKTAEEPIKLAAEDLERELGAVLERREKAVPGGGSKSVSSLPLP